MCLLCNLAIQKNKSSEAILFWMMLLFFYESSYPATKYLFCSLVLVGSSVRLRMVNSEGRLPLWYWHYSRVTRLQSCTPGCTCEGRKKKRKIQLCMYSTFTFTNQAFQMCFSSEMQKKRIWIQRFTLPGRYASFLFLGRATILCHVTTVFIFFSSRGTTLSTELPSLLLRLQKTTTTSRRVENSRHTRQVGKNNGRAHFFMLLNKHRGHDCLVLVQHWINDPG